MPSDYLHLPASVVLGTLYPSSYEIDLVPFGASPLWCHIPVFAGLCDVIGVNVTRSTRSWSSHCYPI
jgi:hypothetical protein